MPPIESSRRDPQKIYWVKSFTSGQKFRSGASQFIYFSSFQMQMILALSRESEPSWSLIKLGFISSLKPMKKSEKESDKKIDLLSI